MNYQPKILVIGSINMDLVISGLKDLPRWGTSSFGGEYHYAVGGKGANQAIAAAKLEAKSYMVGKIGRDLMGDKILSTFAQYGVDTRYLQICDQSATGISTMNIGEEGQYFSINALGANMELTSESLEKALANEPFDMVLMQLEMPLKTVYETYEIAQSYGVPVFLDAGPARQIELENFQGIFAISPNEAEAEALTYIKPDSESNIKRVAEFMREKCQAQFVVLKLGAKGVYLLSDQFSGLLPAYKVKAIDTTAAGDTFAAAFAVSYLQSKSVTSAISAAQAAAAICVTRKGGVPSLPSSADWYNFLEQN